MTSMNDEELRERFKALNADDRASAPAFHTLWSEASQRALADVPLRAATARRRAPIFIAIAAAAVIVIVTDVVLHAGRTAAGSRALADSTAPVPGAAPTIATWRSPTEGFLRAAGDELLHAAPQIQSSILDGVAPPSTQRKGD